MPWPRSGIKQVFLSDFGLVLDRSFDLSRRERDFFAKHRYYSYGQFLCPLADHIYTRFRNLSDSRRQQLVILCDLADDIKNRDSKIVLAENVERIDATGLLRLDPRYVETLTNGRKVIRFMREFQSKQHQNRRKNTEYSQAALRRLLGETGFGDRLQRVTL
jgi:hypothetical protein